MQTLATKIPVDLYASVLRKCADKKCTPSAYVRALLEDDMAVSLALADLQTRSEDKAPEAMQSEIEPKQSLPIPEGRIVYRGVEPKQSLPIPEGRIVSEEEYQIVKGTPRPTAKGTIRWQS